MIFLFLFLSCVCEYLLIDWLKRKRKTKECEWVSVSVNEINNYQTNNSPKERIENISFKQKNKKKLKDVPLYFTFNESLWEEEWMWVWSVWLNELFSSLWDYSSSWEK